MPTLGFYRQNALPAAQPIASYRTLHSVNWHLLKLHQVSNESGKWSFSYLTHKTWSSLPWKKPLNTFPYTQKHQLLPVNVSNDQKVLKLEIILTFNFNFYGVFQRKTTHSFAH